MNNIIGNRKFIHIKLDVDSHAKLKYELDRRNLTMQDALNEFCVMVTNGNSIALKVVDSICSKKVQEKLAYEENKLERRLREAQKENVLKYVDRDLTDDEKNQIYSLIGGAKDIEVEQELAKNKGE